MRSKLVAPVLGAMLLLAACSGGGGGSGTTTLTLWARDSEKTFIGTIVDAFNSSHKNIHVEVTIIPAGNPFVQKLGTATANGSGPDVVSIDLVYVPYFAKAGALEDITSRADSLSYKSGFDSAHMRLATYNDKMYALPFTAESSVVYYNKTLFQKAGLDTTKPPTNWAEMQAAATKIRALGSDYYGYVWPGANGGASIFEIAPMVWASGGEVLGGTPQQSVPMFNSAAVTDMLTFMHGMVQQNLIPPSAATDTTSNSLTAFQGGKVGMVPAGAFYIPQLEGSKTFDYGVFPIPGKTGGYSSFAGGDEIAIGKNTKNESASWTFVQWATDQAAQQTMAKLGVMPVRLDLAPTIYVPLNPIYSTFVQALQQGHTVDSTVENALINDNNGPWATMVHDAIFNGNIKAAQDAAQAKAQSIVAAG
ncbi:MAG TPA: sugar ABC transporter substrate-binding protein [Candidatus Dormibacteraeota bacterium]|nr:sugar ABC transporter substrate-binding protein [Candidatus Dormibacteraeota bacterium]